MRAAVVALATALGSVGYVVLILLRGPQNLANPPHWLPILLVVFGLKGFLVACLVHRIGQLSQDRFRSWMT